MKHLRTTLVPAALIIGLVILSSCMNSKLVDSKVIACDKNEQKFDKTDKEQDAKFLVDAAEMNLEEISLGKLAQQKGSMVQVIQPGKSMEESHTKMLNDLTGLAKRENVSIPTSPTEDGQESYNKLNKKSDNEFAKEYSDLMVKNHKDAVELFEKASTECSDADIKAWAVSYIPTLKSHLEMAQECQKNCAKM